MARPFVVVVTGLLAEARVAQVAPGHGLAGGADVDRLRSGLGRAFSEGAGAVLSFGLAAGLAPRQSPGALVIPSEIIGGGGRYATDQRWSEAMRLALKGADVRPIMGVDAPLIRSADKLQLHAATGAVAADMESHLAAELALRADRPFAALRVICDPLECTLPPAAVVALSRDGSVKVAAVLLSLLSNPRQLPGLMRVAGDARTAMAVLQQCRRILGSDFGWVSAKS